MKTRMQIDLNTKEHNALVDLAESELRDMRQQARLLVREGLKQKGKLNNDDKEEEDE